MSRGVVWITGAGGLIGSHLVRAAAQLAPQWQVVALTRPALDLTDHSQVRKQYLRDRPELILHCAALSRSPACQKDPQLARKLNVEVTETLTQLGAERRLVFFSTDLVFDGKRGNYQESDEVNPLTIYAQTKLEAERIVLANPRHTVVRTSLNGGASPTGDRAFSEQMRQAWAAGKTLTLFEDEFRCPIPASETARAVWRLIASEQPGLYHLAGSERLSRWQIGQLLAKRCPELYPKLMPASAADYPGAPRSADTSLNCVKLERLLSIRLPGLTEWLATHPDEPF